MSVPVPALSTDSLPTHELVLPGWTVRVSAPGPIIEALTRLLTGLNFADEPLPPLRLIVSEDLQWMAGEAPGRPPWRVPLPPAGRLSVLLGQCVAAATALLRRRLFVHAGAVAIGGRGVVIVGGSGTGKTAIVARLLQRGGFYLSDEVALLDPLTDTVAPFAVPMAIKPWTAEAIGPLPGGTDVAGDGEIRFRMPDRVQSDPVPVASFVLMNPSRRHARLTPISRGQMLVALGTHASSLVYRDRLEEAFEGFSRLLRGVDCFAMEGPSAGACADLLIDSWSRRPESNR